MLYIGNISNEEIKYFKGLQNSFPEEVYIRSEHGFDMSSATQVVIDVAKIIEASLPSIIAAIGLVLNYRIEKRKLELEEKRLSFDQQKLRGEQNQSSQNEKKVKDHSPMELEVKYSSYGVTIIALDITNYDSLIDHPDEEKAALEKVESTLDKIVKKENESKH